MACRGMKPLPTDAVYVSLGTLPNCRVDTHGGGYGGILPGRPHHRVSFDVSNIDVCADCGEPLLIVSVHAVEASSTAATGNAANDQDDDDSHLRYVSHEFLCAMDAYLNLDTIVIRPTALDQLYGGLQDTIATLYTALGAHQMGRYAPDPAAVQRAAAAVASWAYRLSAVTEHMAPMDGTERRDRVG